MKRREFLKVSAAAGLVAMAGLESECASICKGEEDERSNTLYDPYNYAEMMEQLQDCVDEDEPVEGESVDTPDPPKPTKNLNENRYYNPHWNVNGSWGKANSRSVLISHLSGPNHGFKLSRLNQLSTDELQKLHDDDHDSRRRWRR